MTEQVQRADFVKRSFDVFFEYYSREPYRSRIACMRNLGAEGISSAVLDVVLNPETYVPIPTGEGASPEMPFDEDSTCIGVVAAAPGEEVTLTVGFHPLQVRDIPTPCTGTTSLPHGSGASIYNPLALHSFNRVSNYYLYRRPTLFLPYEASRKHEYSTVLAHELTHIAQQLMYCVRKYDKSEHGELDRLIDDYNNELDAYQMQEDVFGDDIVPFLMDMTMGTSISVVSHRRRHLQSTGGYVTGENLDAVRRDTSIGPIVGRGFIVAE